LTLIRLHHAQITIPPGHEDQARSFYCGILGLQEIAKPASLRARGGLWVQVSDRQIHIGVEAGVNRMATMAHLAFEVDDLEYWRSTLTELQIIVEDGVPIPGYSRFEFRDPFGNRVEFIEPLHD
jgi:catechol 2,3-dioxygenase-like lactoylglutathione lyase family enzyme